VAALGQSIKCVGEGGRRRQAVSTEWLPNAPNRAKYNPMAKASEHKRHKHGPRRGGDCVFRVQMIRPAGQRLPASCSHESP
jgi:hypothetical protein